ncbi:hypothetical protein PR048_030148 [Dryococelus australis]|uniref:HAT C-terminal dimerisation domain-containing protein n=1 Tax=Dryococelus australis TaxID=614101 RepID=A0ABQ9G851_9NEOP|nr:hypothetical protein PR048_030148 [Dryococelus australis]
MPVDEVRSRPCGAGNTILHSKYSTDLLGLNKSSGNTANMSVDLNHRATRFPLLVREGKPQRTTQFSFLLPYWMWITSGMHDLATGVGVCHKAVLHILHDILEFRKTAAHLIPHQITDVKQWLHCELAQELLNCYRRESEDFLGRNVTTDQTWALSYKPCLKQQVSCTLLAGQGNQERFLRALWADTMEGTAGGAREEGLAAMEGTSGGAWEEGVIARSSVGKGEMLADKDRESHMCNCAVEGLLTSFSDRNREVLKHLIDVTVFLRRQELAFRGHDEREGSSNWGNYVKLVNLLSSYDSMLFSHLETSKVFTGEYTCDGKLVSQTYDGAAVISGHLNGSTEESKRKKEPPTKKQRKSEEINPDCSYRKLYFEIIDNILMQFHTKFSSLENLKFLALLDPNKNEENAKTFPEEAFAPLKSSYGNYFYITHLRSELVAKFNLSEFRSKSVFEIMELLKQSDLNVDGFPELYKLCSLIAAIPAISASVERSFSSLKRIETYIRNSQKQDRLSNLGLLSIKKKFLLRYFEQKKAFYSDVIEIFVRKTSKGHERVQCKCSVVPGVLVSMHLPSPPASQLGQGGMGNSSAQPG